MRGDPQEEAVTGKMRGARMGKKPAALLYARTLMMREYIGCMREAQLQEPGATSENLQWHHEQMQCMMETAQRWQETCEQAAPGFAAPACNNISAAASLIADAANKDANTSGAEQRRRAALRDSAEHLKLAERDADRVLDQLKWQYPEMEQQLSTPRRYAKNKDWKPPHDKGEWVFSMAANTVKPEQLIHRAQKAVLQFIGNMAQEPYTENGQSRDKIRRALEKVHNRCSDGLFPVEKDIYRKLEQRFSGLLEGENENSSAFFALCRKAAGDVRERDLAHLLRDAPLHPPDKRITVTYITQGRGRQL